MFLLWSDCIVRGLSVPSFATSAKAGRTLNGAFWGVQYTHVEIYSFGILVYSKHIMLENDILLFGGFLLRSFLSWCIFIVLFIYIYWCFLHPFHVSFNLRHILKFFFHTTNLLSPHCTMCLCIALRISKITKSQLADLAQFWLKLKISVLSGQKLSNFLGENILIYYLSQMAILWQKTCWGPRLNMRFGTQAH